MTEDIPLDKCSMGPDGIVWCKVNKNTAKKIESLDIKPKKIVFEIE